MSTGRAYEPTVAEQEALVGYLTDRIVGDATGENDGDRCVGESPSGRYYLATLAPTGLDLSAGRTRRGRATPSSAGFEFLVEGQPPALELFAKASVYCRVFPTLAEQLEVSDPELTQAERLARTYPLRQVFRRRTISVGPLQIELRGTYTDQRVGREELEEALQLVADEAVADGNAYRREDRLVRDITFSGAELENEATWAAFIAAQPGRVPKPDWHAAIWVLARPYGGERKRVSVLLENLSNPARRLVRGEDRVDHAREHFLFNVRVEARATLGSIVPLEMDLGPDAYRYDPRLHAYAVNCGVEEERAADGTIARLFTVPAPVHQTYRTPSEPHPATSFEVLERDPLPALDLLARDLEAFADDPAWDPTGLDERQAARKRLDREQSRLEAARLREGMRWLRRDPRLLRAFQLTNRTMVKLNNISGRQFEAWRRFQLVFLVSNLPALAWREHDPAEFTPGLWGDPEGRDPTAAATVLWFPTGQGKTEAYLGLIACALFYDRLRGKGRGVTAWCRFPLRLLSLQQTERQLDLVVAAEQVRAEIREEIEREGGDPGVPFSIGFYVGEANTPNTLSRDATLKALGDPLRRRENRVIDRCPYCRKKAVEIPEPDATELRLIHRCTSCGRDLPMYVVDTEIYRYLPAVVVGTIDKLAMIGLSDRFGALLGDVDCECTLHGFGRGMKCHERRAAGHPPKGTVAPLARPLYDPSPSLEIVDELHMLDEELGAFAGHYEGALVRVQEELTRRQREDQRAVRMKVICTSATVKGEDRQTEHLFGLPSVVVPLPGPQLERSFYWTVRKDQPLRRFVGVMPHRATAELTMARVLQTFHTTVRALEARGSELVPGLAGMPRTDFDALLDPYRVSLTYVTSLVDFGKLRRTMDSQVNEQLRHLGLREVKVADLSGDTAFEQVGSTLEDLQRPGGEIEAVIGTSMVSHGVDIARLDFMLFDGMPKAMAEYIQASSRVGRQQLGLVFMIFNPIRERDRSHFRYHAKFHEYLDRMVQPVAINRWSRYAAQKTVPGVLMAEILQVANRDYWGRGRAPRHLHELARMKEAMREVAGGGIDAAQPDALLEGLRRAYGLDKDGASEIAEEIAADLNTALANLRMAGAGATLAARSRPNYQGTPDYLGLRYEPMLSLRDVAEGIPFIVLSPRRPS